VSFLRTKIFHGRWAAHSDEPFVVFMIGMRINRFFSIRKWTHGAIMFTRMYRHLLANPGKGFLGGQQIVYGRGIGMIQYWRSFEDLERYARSHDELHIPAWRTYNRRVGNDGKFGIWHETYLVDPAAFEAIYDNMPKFGLGTAAARPRCDGSAGTTTRPYRHRPSPRTDAVTARRARSPSSQGGGPGPSPSQAPVSGSGTPPGGRPDR
jgi:hypothetical protein